ncbi:MAG: hypothetical protein AAF567_26315 [Actinomycetota bacterium]
MDGDTTPPADDRWQQLMGAFDPERNIRAFADMMQQAAAGSEQVLGSVTGPRSEDGEATGPSPLRDAFAEMERSFSKLYDVAGRFMVERPFGGGGGTGHAGTQAEVVVIDSVGTTSIEIGEAEANPHCSDLRRHDGATIAADAVRILRSDVGGTVAPTFVIRVDAPEDTEAGTYHGQILVEGLPDLALGLTVRVIDDE